MNDHDPRKDYDRWRSTKEYKSKEPVLSETGSVLSNKYLYWPEDYSLDNGE